MQNKNIDGIQIKQSKGPVILRRSSVVMVTSATTEPKSEFWNNRRVLPLVVAFAILISFIGGMWAEQHTVQSQASEIIPGGVVANMGSFSADAKHEVPTIIFTNLTVDQVKGYLEEVLKTPELRHQEKLAERRIKLAAYLQFKQSPLIEITDTLINLKHWQMVLAISNSESSLGKRCYDNNCSGIGVEPGHKLWREYKTKADWAKDLDRLIERRYKGWTLEEMNGVYNQPGSANWILAARKILEDLQEREIN